MVAIFTPQPELQKFAYDLSKNQVLPNAQFKGATQYEGRVRVRRAANADVSFELLDDTWAGAGIAENDIFVAEDGGIAVQGAWFLRTVIAGEERNVDPVAPSAEILHTFLHAVSSDPICPNFVRGVLDQIVNVRLSEFVALNSNNHRNRGTLGESAQGASDSLRQLTFAGTVSGDWRVGSVATGGTSGAVGVVVGLSPGISQGLVGNYVIVDMGVDYAGVEWTLGEAVTTPEASGTLDAGALGARSISPLFRQAGAFDDYVPAGFVENIDPDGISNMNVGAGGAGDNKLLLGSAWTPRTRIGDFVRMQNTGNGNDGTFGPILGFEQNGPTPNNTAIFAADFPNADNAFTGDQVVTEIVADLTERTLVALDHAADIPIVGDPQIAFDLSGGPTWNGIGVYEGDIIEVIEASPAFTSGSRPFDLFRVIDIPGGDPDRVNVFPLFTPSTQFDSGTITVYRRRPA